MASGRKKLWLGLAVLAAVALGFAIFSQSDQEKAAARAWAEAEARHEALLPQARAGDPEAQFQVAEQLRHGHGVARNPDSALAWYLKAAAKAHVGAQYALGTLYANGEGVAVDFARAAEWYKLAARLGGNADAEFALAQLYYDGRGVENDPSEAIAWYRKAADGGHPAAQYILGDIYRTGWNVEADPAQAYKWFTLAMRRRAEAMAVNRRFDPEKARAELIRTMSQYQIARGEQWAKEWRPRPQVATFVRPGASLVRAPEASAATEEAPKPGLAVRLLSFGAPVAGDNPPPAAVSLIVDFADPADKEMACALTPRIREAVFHVLWQEPIRQRGGVPDLRSADGRLVEPVNRAIGKEAVRRVFLFPGNEPLGANQVLQTPFTAVEECAASPAAAKPAR